MAKTVGDLLIKLGVDGIEGVTQLKSALRGLSKAAGPADSELEKLAKQVKEFNRQGAKSRDVISGQLSALKSLRNQAGLGGKAFRSLTKDIVDYQQKLAAADAQIDKTTKKFSTLAQVTSQIPARKTGSFASQIAAFTKELDDASVTSEKYANILRNIQERTTSFQRAQSRQAVIAAGTTAAQGPVDPRTAFRVTTELPRTTAALSLRLTELREDFQNIAVGSKQYVNALREINLLESQIGDPFGTAARKQEIRGRLGQQQTFGMFAPRDPVQSAIARRERRRSRRYGGFAGGGLANQPAEATGLFRTIASIGSAEAKAATEMMGRSLSQVTAEINRQAAASNGSINSLQAQRTAFAQLRAGLDPTSQDFRELGKEIEKVDRRLAKLNKTRRRPTIGGIAQGLGGIAAGGVFGGPEGALGAAVGGAVGGVAGVAAGAALGAQVKMMREALGATSDYAAQLQKLEIALEGVAGPEYTNALKAANQVTKDFNVPIDVSTRGITRLSAAVIGAKGTVGDAEVVFRNITSAIKATGGGAQDVESAITAMVQTFSKGKVSAEELSGQLGERLPGAVTKFAEANEMTLPELQKSLKAGTVGLDELMKFIISLGPEYEETARAIADSSADAGARAAVAFQEVRREVGEALQPIGAQLQQAFGRFVLDILPAIKAGAVAAANGLNALLDASSFLIANFKELLIVAGAAGIALALQNLIGIATALGTAFGKATVAMKGFTAASLLNPWVALAAGITAATVALVKHSRKNAEFNKSVIAGETTNEEANDRLREMNDKVQELENRLGKETNNRMIQALTRQLKTAKIAAGDLELAMKLASSYEVAGIKYDRMTGRPINAPMSYSPTDFDDPTPDPSADADKDISDAMMNARLNGMREVITLADVEAKLANDLLQISLQDLKTNEEIVARAEAHRNAEQSRLQIEQQLQTLQENIAAQVDKAKLASGEITQEAFNQNELERQRLQLQRELLPLLLAEKLNEKEIAEIIETILNGVRAGQDQSKSFVGGLRELIDEATNLNDILAEYGVQAVDRFANTFADFVATGKASFSDFARSVLQDLSRIFARAAFFTALDFIFPGIGKIAKITGSAKGNVFAQNKILPYAKGGIVNKPTLFQYANGGSGRFGLMGEAGAEAIMPLRRGRDGRLGVESSGGGTTNVNVNVDASGSSVQGNSAQASQLGKAIGAAVQTEILRQKRPGGLLAGA